MPMLCHKGTASGHDLVPSRRHSEEHFSTDSTARKRKPERAAVMFESVAVLPLRMLGSALLAAVGSQLSGDG